jgi:hypothetical protein
LEVVLAQERLNVVTLNIPDAEHVIRPQVWL